MRRLDDVLTPFLFGRSIRARLVLILSLAILPPAIMALVQAYSDYEDERALIERNLAQVGQIITAEHEKLIAGARQTLKALASQDEVRLATNPQCRQSVRAIAGTLPNAATIAVLDRRGKVVCADDRQNEDLDLSERPWFKSVLENPDFVVVGVFDSRLTRDKAIIVAVPLRDARHRAVGALTLHFGLYRILALPADMALPPGTFIVLVSAAGQSISASGSAESAVPTLSGRDIIKRAAERSVAVVHTRSAEGEAVTLAVTPLLDGGMHVIVGQRSVPLFAWSRIKLATKVAIPLLIWLAALAAAWFVGQQAIVRWIIYLQRFASAYAKGAHSIRPGRFEGAPTELRELSEALRHMMDTIAERDAQLKEAIAHREMLIKEIHHRVKNNLQIVASLLNLQARRMHDDRERKALVDLHHRIDALALVHRSLYEAQDLERVELKSFFEALGMQLRELVGADRRSIALKIEMPAKTVAADAAVSLAMLVTEGVTNAFKHAFADQATGSVTVRLEMGGDGSATLTIADDGMGYRPGGSDTEPGQGLGHLLMEGFARQLGGDFSIETDGGTVLRVRIPRL